MADNILYVMNRPYHDVRTNKNHFHRGGMKPGTRGSMGCKESIGQVYTRTGHINDLFAIMYSWYVTTGCMISSSAYF